MKTCRRYIGLPDDGFSLLELMVVIFILAALASIAIPRYVVYRQQALAAECLSNRHQAEMAERAYFLEYDQPSLAIADTYSCPSGGVYVWLVSDPEVSGYPKLICSLHGTTDSAESDNSAVSVPTTTDAIAAPEQAAQDVAASAETEETEALTSLGSSFEEIISQMVGLIEAFYTENDRYPRSWGDYRFTDIGLDPEEWAVSYDGIIYTPIGNRVTIEPAEGFRFFVTDIKGKEQEITPASNWNLLYSIEDEKWYFKMIHKNNEIDISTLTIVNG